MRSLRAQFFKFLQCLKIFKGPLYLDPEQQPTLVVLCQGKGLMAVAARKRTASSKGGPGGTASFSTPKANSCWVRLHLSEQAGDKPGCKAALEEETLGVLRSSWLNVISPVESSFILGYVSKSTGSKSCEIIISHSIQHS